MKTSAVYGLSGFQMWESVHDHFETGRRHINFACQAWPSQDLKGGDHSVIVSSGMGMTGVGLRD